MAPGLSIDEIDPAEHQIVAYEGPKTHDWLADLNVNGVISRTVIPALGSAGESRSAIPTEQPVPSSPTASSFLGGCDGFGALGDSPVAPSTPKAARPASIYETVCEVKGCEVKVLRQPSKLLVLLQFNDWQ